MSLIAALAAFVLVWGVSISAVGALVREPLVIMFGTTIASITAAVIAWVVA